MSLLSIKDLRVDLPSDGERNHAVTGVTLDVAENELVCIVGESGSGKSILAHSILGLLPPKLVRSKGSIKFNGRTITDLSSTELRKLRGAEISMIFQEPMTALNPLMRIGDQIDETIRFHGKATRIERCRMTERALEDVGLNDTGRVMSSYPFQLSGGQRQRVMIAMGLVLEPKLLIADEPTTALDVTTQSQILRLIKDLQQRHRMSVLFITHDFGVVAEIADRVVVMEKGVIVEQGEAALVLSEPSASYTRKLVASVPQFQRQAARTIADAKPMLEVRSARKRFSVRHGMFSTRSVTAVDGISLDVAAGECLGIVGESGSGKSTLGRMLMRIIEPDEGDILLAGRDITRASGRTLREARRDIQMVFQDPYSSFNPRRTVGDQIISGPCAWGTDRKTAIDDAAKLLTIVGLPCEALSKYPHQFSGGQRQRLSIARALALKPRVVIADEPVSALDVTVQDQVLGLFEQVRDTLDIALIFITHDLRVAARMCDRIAVMQKGEIVELRATNDLFDAPSKDYTKTLMAAVPGARWE